MLHVRRRNRYHTDFIFKAQIGLLSDQELAMVPASTLCEWKGRNFSGIVGFDPSDPVFQKIEFHRDFLSVKSLAVSAKCLWKVYCCYSSLLSKLKNRLKVFRENKDLVVETIIDMSEDAGVASACRMLGISASRFYRWANEKICSRSIFSLCRKTNSQQLTIEEQEAVRSILLRPELKDKPWISAYYRMMNEGMAFMNFSTFCRYAIALFGKRNGIRKPKQKKGKRASAPLELLHMDTTVVQLLDGTRAFVHLIVDNFSRAILGWKIARTCSSSLAVQNLKEVCEQYNLYYKPLQLWCDNGSENEGEVNTFLLRPDVSIEKQVARVDVTYSNSMVEAANKRLKYFHLFPRDLKHYEDLKSSMSEIIHDENSREQGSLFGYTPIEVLQGAMPDKHRYSRQIQKAKKERTSINRKQKCPIC